MSRTGKSARDIFAPTRPTAPEPEPQKLEAAPEESTSLHPVPEPVASRRPGRPPVHDEQWAKVTVILLNRHIVYLDRLSADIRERTGRPIKRAELIRALIETLAESGVDVTSATSESEVKDRLTRALAG